MGEARTEAEAGNAYVRQARYRDALAAYRRAVEVEATFAEGHLACAELAHVMRDEDASGEYMRRALALKRVFLDPLPVGGRLPVVLLLRDAPYNVNTPFEMILDRTRIAVHKAYVEGSVALPTGVPICAFGYAREAENAIVRASEVAPHCLNDPTHLRRCAREELATTLAGIDGVVPVATRRVSAMDVDSISLPALVRPADTHAGEGLLFAQTPNEVDAHHQRWHAASYHVSTFVEYRSSDGYHRKYRIVLVDGVAYPYHLAIAQRWMVHYRTSATSEHPWMQEEEAHFLSEPRAVFPQWDALCAAIHERIGLDYVGLDVARLPDGRMLVFEADPAMLIHDSASIREALHALLGKHMPL